jgi:hypothetical protein
MYGYLLAFLFSSVIAGIAVYLIFVIFVGMSLSGSNNVLPIILVIGSYFLATYILAIFARQIFNSNQWLAFALNVSSVVFIISLIFLLNQYKDYASERKKAHNAQTAIADAPYIRLEAPFVKKVQVPNGGVALFIHVPFTVTKVIRAQSLMVLAPIQYPRTDIKYSSNPFCNSGYDSPPYGFHLVDREYTESPLPSHVTGTEIVSEELEPNKHYYLLRELYFTHFSCRISDYDDFDVRQLNIKLNTARAKGTL